MNNPLWSHLGLKFVFFCLTITFLTSNINGEEIAQRGLVCLAFVCSAVRSPAQPIASFLGANLNVFASLLACVRAHARSTLLSFAELGRQ